MRWITRWIEKRKIARTTVNLQKTQSSKPRIVFPTFNPEASRSYILHRLKTLTQDVDYQFQTIEVKWLIGEIEALQLEKKLLSEGYSALEERSRLAYEQMKLNHDFEQGT